MRNTTNLLNTLQYADALREAEKEIYLAAYKHAGGNQSHTAKLLGVSRETLRTKLKKFNFERTVKEKTDD